MPRTPLVLLPGLLCDERLWAPQCEALADIAEMTVADLTQDETMQAMAARVLAAAPERFALAGLSMGGYLALEIVHNAPDRVERLALLDSQARADTALASRRRRGLIELSQKGQFKGVTPKLLPLFLAGYNLDNAELVGTVQAMAESVGKDAFIRQQKAIMGRSDLRPYLHEIACPTLILAGRDDALTPPPLQEEMAGAIPRADLVILSRSGHLSTIERPSAVNAALRNWLSAA